MFRPVQLSARPLLTGAALLAAAAILVSCARPVDQAAEAERLMQTSREWSQVAQSRDIDRILSFWADDAVVIAPGEPERRGKAAIRAYLEASQNVPGFAISWEPIEARVSASGDLGYLIERTEVTVTGPEGRPLTQQFRAVTLWRKEADGAWRNVVDISNAPPGATPS
jgi:uncharacterized protein (TIGR02246 family)